MPSLKSLKNKYLSASDGAVLGVTTNTENISLLSFKLATADSLSKFNLVDGFSDDYNDGTGVDASASTDEIRSSTANYYSGGVTGNATGGTETSYSSGGNDYKVHTFLTTSTFTISGGTGNVDILVVAAGGGAGGNDGNNGAGGGGGGGMREITGSSMTEAVFDVTVGTGGLGAKGGNSSVVYSSGPGSGFTAISGTGGGAGGGTTAGSTGGSGGGHGGYSGPAGAAGNEGGYTPVEGYDGGDGSNGGGSPPCPSRNGGGGGGAGGAGGNAPARSGNSSGPGGGGGTGRQNNWRTGSNVYYAGGGGGAGTAGGGSAGTGGGGAGGSGYGAPGTDGTANTGGGGGGGSHGTSGSTGGSGIVVLRYIDGAFVAYNDMTLQSNVFTAQAAPTTARIVMDEFTAAGSSTLNTDIKAYASRDGTNFTQMTLADQGYLNPNSGIDGYTKLMLHCDGSNSGTTFTDSSLSDHTVTASGNAVTNVATKKFGTASYKCPATGDFLSIPDSEDWNFGSGDFTIDCWLYRTGTSAYQTIAQHKTDNSNYWQWRYFGGSGNFDFTVTGAGAFSVNWTVSAFAQDTWVHHQLVRNGNSWYMFQNGTQVGGTQTQAAAVPNMTGNLILQGDSSLGQPFVGYMDEFRISKGIARNTSNFAVPSGEYVESRRLLTGSADISGQPAGTDMKYKITTHNQTLAKQTRVYGTSMAWA